MGEVVCTEVCAGRETADSCSEEEGFFFCELNTKFNSQVTVQEERARKMEEKKMAQYQLKQKADIHFLLWKDAKEMEIREERKKRLEGERRQDEKKAAEKANIASKAEESYSHWLEMKRMKEEKTVRKAQEAKLDNEERVFQRKIENERSFNDWVAEKRHQYSNPLPVFRNPEAWQVCIPKEKKRVKVKRVEKVHLPASPPNLFKGRKTSKATIGWS
eukprot:m.33876 g.33876  ORF g.33876 m.33876 type:complete len:217 (+) comp31924_c0_seq4:922-1572(+)